LVKGWREARYDGATATSKLLLNYWFRAEHRLRDNQPFRYYAAQREAIETLIWLYEVAQVRRHRDLLERFATAIGLHVLRYDDFARYAIKMATGRGKTKVMALAIAWQYFNAVAEGRNDLREDATRLGNHRVVPVLEEAERLLSSTEPFPFSRPTFEAHKTIYNLVAADNEFEREFAKLLEAASDVRSFAKLPQRFGFTIEYTDSATNLRYYEPDFVAVDEEGIHHLIETKGREDIDVAFKDRAATIWCENATLLTGISWRYVKVPQAEFTKLQATDLSDIILAFSAQNSLV
jgi:hypothetical protein